MENSNLLPLSTIIAGDVGHPVVLVHDLNASLNDWDALIPALVGAGYMAYACDLFGHGQSPCPDDPAQYHAQLHLTALRRWIDGFNFVRAPILIGHGFGAYLSLRYTIGHPYRVFKLVLINPILTPTQIAPTVLQMHRQPWLGKLARSLAPGWAERQILGIRKDTNPDLARRITLEARRASPFNQSILPGIVDMTSMLYELPTTSLFLLGQDDPLFDMSVIPELVEDRPDLSCVTLPGMGHRPHMEAPEEINKLIVNFLHGI